MQSRLKLMRIPHYIKNVLIFLPLFFGRQLFYYPAVRQCLLGFIAFSFLASAVYIINDIQDVESDRLHPSKSRRPLAAGEITINQGRLMAAALIILAAGLNYLAAGLHGMSWLILGLYLLINILYSAGLKNIPVLDVVILVSGFFLRMVYGSLLIGVALSPWLYLTVVAMSFYLGFGKRRNDMVRQGKEGRVVYRFYKRHELDKVIYLCLVLTVAFYAFWTIDVLPWKGSSGGGLVWTVILVIAAATRYHLILEGDSQGDPVEIMLADPLFIGLIVGLNGVLFRFIYS